jgi:hypothetical protein
LAADIDTKGLRLTETGEPRLIVMSPAGEDKDLTLDCLREHLADLVDVKKAHVERIEMDPTNETSKKSVTNCERSIDLLETNISHVESFNSEVGAVIAAGGFRSITFGGSPDWCVDWALFDVLENRQGPNNVSTPALVNHAKPADNQ